MSTAAVVIMAKQPVPGSSKTRLAPVLDAPAAASLADAFLRDAVASICSIARIEPKIAIWPPTSRRWFESVAPGLQLVEQVGDGLPARLDHVMRQTSARHDIAIAINADSPTLPPTRIDDALDKFADPTVDVVFGPTEDGGYYLIGWRRPHERLIADVAMSTPNVLLDSLAIADELGLRAALLEPWYDVDEPLDLARLRAEVAAGSWCGAHTRRWLESHP